MILVFLRHGERLDRSLDAPLTERGREQALEMGRWLKAQAVLPTHLLHTGKQRTRDTVRLAVQGFGMVPEALPMRVRAGLPKALAPWERMVEEFQQLLPPRAVVLMSGHHATDNFLRKHFGLPREQEGDRLAAILEPGPEGFRCTRYRF